MTHITATKLRQNIYRILDRVAKTGEPIAVERKGVLLKIAPQSRLDVFAALPKRKITRGDPEKLVHINWGKYWKPKLY